MLPLFVHRHSICSYDQPTVFRICGEKLCLIGLAESGLQTGISYDG